MRYLRRPTTRYAGAVALAIVIPMLLGILLDSAIEGVIHGGDGFPWWMVEFGTLGQTILVYSTLLRVLSSVAVPVLTFYLGYRYGTRRRSPPGR